MLLLLSLILYASGGFGVHRAEEISSAELDKNVALLRAAEQGPIPDLHAEARAMRRALLEERGGIMVDDLEAEKQRILQLEEWNKPDFKAWFADSAIVGDSIIRASLLYGWMDSSVYAKGGVSISADLELLDEVEAAHPGYIFLAFGSNDVGKTKGKTNIFIKRYRGCLERLQASLPDAIIYIVAIPPVNEKALSRRSVYAKIPEYNAALQELAKEMGVFFLDTGFLLESKPELYDADGIHPKRNYYPLWLTFVADVAGLSHEET